MLNANDSNMAANAICHAAEMIRETIRQAVYEYERPATVHKPRLFVDGDHWCALYGENLQDGVAGFGHSPSAAMHAFDKAWNESLPAAKAKALDDFGDMLQAAHRAGWEQCQREAEGVALQHGCSELSCNHLVSAAISGMTYKEPTNDKQ